MTRPRSIRRRFSPFLALAVLLVPLLVITAVRSSASDENAPHEMPRYDEGGELVLPESYREWILVGTSRGLSYSEVAPGHTMIHNTLMEPTAYQHYRETGEFREGTMLVLLLFGEGDASSPGRHGFFAAETHGVEMAVKDSSRFDEGWAYYNFGGMGGLRDTAAAFDRQSCYACHVEHAQQDNVFVQFYSLLQQVRPAQTATATSSSTSVPTTNTESMDGRLSGTATDAVAEDGSESRSHLALAGLDPVHLVRGREEMGKPEIVMVHEGFRYQFVSEPSRVAFEVDPEAFSIRNDTCPVAPGTPIDPSLFVVHEESIYAFATPQCVAEFQSAPDRYLDTP